MEKALSVFRVQENIERVSMWKISRKGAGHELL